MKRKTARTNLILEIILWIFSLVTIYPLLMVVMTSFKSKGEASYLNITLPGEWHFENPPPSRRPHLSRRSSCP